MYFYVCYHHCQPEVLGQVDPFSRHQNCLWFFGHQGGWCNVNMRSQVHISARLLAILTESFHGFYHFLQVNSGMVHWNSPCQSLSHYSWSSYHHIGLCITSPVDSLLLKNQIIVSILCSFWLYSKEILGILFRYLCYMVFPVFASALLFQ